MIEFAVLGGPSVGIVTVTYWGVFMRRTALVIRCVLVGVYRWCMRGHRRYMYRQRPFVLALMRVRGSPGLFTCMTVNNPVVSNG